MTLEELNNLSTTDATAVFKRCCGSTKWSGAMALARPFKSWEHVHAMADEAWANVNTDDVMEAFSHHPKIGGDPQKLRQKFPETAAWSEGEQASVADAGADVITRLAEQNLAYDSKFGYLFIVCATGKSATEMLEILESRLPNEPQEELAIAKGEQAKITHIRLEKLRT